MQVYEYPESTNYTLYNTFEHPVIGLKMYGKSVQDGTPTPEVPVDIVSVGDDGAVEVTACGKNLLSLPYADGDVGTVKTTNGITFTVLTDGGIKAQGTATATTFFNISRKKYSDVSLYNSSDGKVVLSGNVIYYPANTTTYIQIEKNATVDKIYYPQLEFGTVATSYETPQGNTASITSGLPLCSVNGVRDELIYNADGTGKIIKRTARLGSYNGEVITTDYISSTGGLDVGATIVYVLDTPQEIELSAAEMAALMKLQTFDWVTSAYNSENAEMQIIFLGGNEMQTNIDGFWDSEDGDKKYSAADFVGFFQDFFTNGIVAESTTYLQVMAKSGFEVAVNVGKAYINGCFFKPKTITTLAIEESDGTSDRTDIVVIRWDKPLRQIYLAVKKGTTTLTRNELVYELGIAKIVVKASATEITQANISDLRFDNAYCGVVTGVIDTINTTKLFAQYEAEWNNFVAQLGESDNVTISAADEQARADITTLNASFEELTAKALTSTSSGLKVLTGSVTGTGKHISFSEPFTSEPKIAISITPSSTSSGFIYSGYIRSVSASGFYVEGQSSDGTTIADKSCTFRWIAIGA